MLRDLWAMLYPDLCVSCEVQLVAGEAQLCTTCRVSLPLANYHQSPQDNDLAYKLGGRLPLQYTLAYLRFSRFSKVQRIIHSLKYYQNPEIGIMLGEWYGAVLREAGFAQQFEIILPVPLHPHKLKKRGYNQSACFAEGLGKALAVPWSDTILQRRIATDSQTRKGKMARWYNVAEIFELADEQAVAGKHILLVDDVITTGATLEACAQTLVRVADCRLSIAAIAHASR